MKMLRQALIILGICLLAEVIQQIFSLTIPANVIGMILLLLFLLSGIVKVEMVEDSARFLLKHLAFFFVPAGVSLMNNFEMLKGNWLRIFAVVIISTIIVQVVTGCSVQYINLRRGK
ncbi:CidA/LrgA family protein [Serpentinicella sp. ANB-PHB4]|uniref:CidA/LrgA family protein n=1 Tax=Serpentinicella sp. ANB-PHB4 TaxID=3074076 RepID=UPI0028547A59|nr:CidA/LrgA family protein [Serpentinicella sp. ANB-PHB4]MDR5658751.1 CidA/LrgA family protein [Serpentinicella sp. ANB-PHB4]